MNRKLKYLMFVILLFSPSIIYSALFIDVSGTNLPAGLEGPTLDAAIGDIDNDGDPDIVIAHEFQENIILINDGTGHFTNSGSERLNNNTRDSEDIGLADFNGDGYLDIIFVSEEDETNELFLNDGNGYFTEVTERLPDHGISNGVVIADINNDGHQDILVGNNGQNFAFINDGEANFTNSTSSILPQKDDITQDLFLADVDGDGDQDLLTGNQDANLLHLNNGQGVFTETENQIPLITGDETTREVVAGDLDGDGDLDLVYFNLGPAASDGGTLPQNRLLVNDGHGMFTEVMDNLPWDDSYSWDGALVDLDNDGDLDIISCSVIYPPQGGSRQEGRYKALINDGKANFTDKTNEIFPETAKGFGWDVETADFDGDGSLDLFFCAKNSASVLLLGTTSKTYGKKPFPVADEILDSNGVGPATSMPVSPVNKALLKNQKILISGVLPTAISVPYDSPVALTLYDLKGQIQKRLTLNSSATLNLFDLSQGMYIIRITQQNFQKELLLIHKKI